MPVAVLRKSADRRASVISVGLGRRNGKQAKPVIGENRAIGRQLVAPGIILSVGAAARRIFPLGLGRQRLSGPFGLGLGLAMRDLDDGMIFQSFDRAFGHGGRPPVGAGDEGQTFRPLVAREEAKRV